MNLKLYNKRQSKQQKNLNRVMETGFESWFELVQMKTKIRSHWANQSHNHAHA